LVHIQKNARHNGNPFYRETKCAEGNEEQIAGAKRREVVPDIDSPSSLASISSQQKKN